MSTALLVLLCGRVIGTVDRSTHRGVLRFTYHPDPNATPLSLSMPPTGQTYTGERVERFLRGLTPEHPGALTAIERRYPGTNRHDLLSVLSAIGSDCPGAVQFCTPDRVEELLTRGGDLTPQSTSDIEHRIAAMRTDENASWTMPGEHWSLGGAQPKFALRWADGQWYQAGGAQATSHIFKPGVHGMTGQSLVEHITMRAAHACGLNVAHTEYPSFGTESLIVITRFDRADVDGTLTRLHQEDMCQALGVYEKYEEHGGPSARDIVTLLRDRSATASASRRNVAAFVDAVVFNTVMAAPDAHARNYAVLLDGSDVTLAPLFDLATALPYTPTDAGRVLSMSIGGEFVADRVVREHWLRFAQDVGVDGDRLVERGLKFLGTAPQVMLDVLDGMDDWDGSVARLRKRLVAGFDSFLAVAEQNLAVHG